MKSLSRVLGISLLTGCAFVGVNSAKAATECNVLESLGIQACIEDFDACVADNGSNCTQQRSSCFAEVQAMYQECVEKGDPVPPPPGPPAGVAYRQNSIRAAQRSLLLNLSSPRIMLDLRLQ